MPYGLLEAMAAGLPAASTDVGDIKAIVAEPNRPFIVPTADEAGLAAALGRLLCSAELRARLGEANRIKAESEFALDTMIAAYDRLFESAAGRAGTLRLGQLRESARAGTASLPFDRSRLHPRLTRLIHALISLRSARELVVGLWLGRDTLFPANLFSS